MPGRKTDKQLLDEAIAAQAAGTYQDPLLGAKKFLSKRTVVDDADRLAKGGRGASSDLETQLNEESRVGPAIRQAATTAAIPAAFLSGPAGLVAGGILAAEGAANAVEDPTAMNVGMAGLGLLPFIGPVKNAVQSARTAKSIKGVRDTYGAGDMGAAFSREVPYRMGRSTQAPTTGPIDAAPETMLQRARAQVDDFLNPVPTEDLPMGLQELLRPGAQRFMQREFAANRPVVAGLERSGVIGGDRMVTGVPKNVPRSTGKYPLPETPGEPAVTRVPMGVSGNEFAGVKPYGPSTRLSPEEEALADEFWEEFINNYGR